uniref:Uncharacterized protein n=1 Tax=Setaria italica TaxID=4555 RepID=K3ZMM9_SETIT
MTFYSFTKYHKQPLNSVLYKYYMCEFLRNNGSTKLDDKDIDTIGVDIARFIQCEICHDRGAKFDPDGVLATDECKSLRNWV